MALRSALAGSPGRVLAESDCERCGEGFITQPANTVSSLAYVAVGAHLLRQPDPDRVFAWSVIGVGVGSVALHGPGGVAGTWLHDATLLAMLTFMTISDARERAPGSVPSAGPVAPLPAATVPVVVAGSAIAAHPAISDRSQAVVGAASVVAGVRGYFRRRSLRSVLVGAPLWTLGATLQFMGRTGQPWCRPESPFQAHAGWHVVSAAALWSRKRF